MYVFVPATADECSARKRLCCVRKGDAAGATSLARFQKKKTANEISCSHFFCLYLGEKGAELEEERLCQEMRVLGLPDSAAIRKNGVGML